MATRRVAFPVVTQVRVVRAHPGCWMLPEMPRRMLEVNQEEKRKSGRILKMKSDWDNISPSLPLSFSLFLSFSLYFPKRMTLSSEYFIVSLHWRRCFPRSSEKLSLSCYVIIVFIWLNAFARRAVTCVQYPTLPSR